MDGVYYAFNQALTGPWQPQKTPSGITTFCNFSVNSICKSVGYLKFEVNSQPLMANEMIRSMKDPNGDWMQLGSGEVAQAKANEGSLVIAGYAVPGGHGHVAVIVPGLLEFSGTWQKLVPRCMNVGQTVFFGKKVSWAFRADQEPDFWGLKELL